MIANWRSTLSRRSLMVGSALGALALGVSAAPAQEASWEEVVAAANEEGQVTFYNNLQPNGIEPLIAQFNAEYPDIAVEYIRLGSNPLIERFETEFNAGRHLADVLITFPDQRIYAGQEAGWMAQWTPPEIGNFPEEINEDDELFTLQYSREAIIWNTGLVSEEDAPREWADLLDAKWAGKVGMNPPWRSVSIQQIVAFWDDIGLGDSAQILADNDVRFFEGSGGIIQAVIRGDVQVAELTDLPLNPLLEDGAPIGFVYPESGTTLSANKVFVAANAPHPNAAKVFVNWMMTETGQNYLQEYAGLSVTRNGAPPLSQLPATSELTNVVDGEDILTPERQEEIVTHWRTVFGIQ